MLNVRTGQLLAAPNIGPNKNGLPGVTEAEHIVGALLTFGVIAAVAGVALSAIVWAIGGHSVNPQMTHRGKTGVIVSLAAAVLIGGADTLVQFFTHAGAGL